MITWIIAKITSITFVDILTFLLTLDTLRAVLAFLGWVNPRSKFGRIIYGKQDTHIISAALQELGYSADSSNAIIQRMKKNAKFLSESSGITDTNAAEHLVAMLANYIVKFENKIQYGVDSISQSNFYIDTMEIPHNERDLQEMSAIMSQLINTHRKKHRKKKPKIIATPKGGNPLFTKEVAKPMGANLILAKGKKDKSRASGIQENTINDFRTNYEGFWTVLNGEPHQSCIIVDCNTSGGSQLLDIVKNIRNLVQNEGHAAKIQEPDEAYVLFRADLDGEAIDQKFADVNCALIRYFDLDEATKEKLYQLKTACEAKGRRVSVYYEEDKTEINNIISSLKDNKKFYYKQ